MPNYVFVRNMDAGAWKTRCPELLTVSSGYFDLPSKDRRKRSRLVDEMPVRGLTILSGLRADRIGSPDGGRGYSEEETDT